MEQVTVAELQQLQRDGTLMGSTYHRSLQMDREEAEYKTDTPTPEQTTKEIITVELKKPTKPRKTKKKIDYQLEVERRRYEKLRGRFEDS